MSPTDSRANAKPIMPPMPDLRNSRDVQSSPDQQHQLASVVEKLEQPWIPEHRFLSPSEWSVFAHGVGGIEDGEGQKPARPRAGVWPAKGMPRGLYKDVVIQRAKCYYLYHATSIFRWTLLIVQIILGSTLTALGPSSVDQSVPITVLGASNTVVAGLLALMHNSGLPDRLRHDMQEFERVEDRIRSILEGRYARAEDDADQIMANCFAMFTQAKATVAANAPATYNPQKNETSSQKTTQRPSLFSPRPMGNSQRASANVPNGGKSVMT